MTTAKIVENTKLQKVVKSGFKSGVISTSLIQYQILHLLSPITINYIKVPVIYKVESQWCQSGVTVGSKAQIGLFLWFFMTYPTYLFFGCHKGCFMMLVKYNLLITFSRKKKLASRKDKNGCGHKVGQPEITPMGPPWVNPGGPGRVKKSSLSIKHKNQICYRK